MKENPPCLPLPDTKEMDWPSLVDTATKAMMQVSSLDRSMSARMFPPPFPSSVVNTSSPRPLSNYVIPPTITQCVPNSSPSVSWQNYPSRPPLRPMMHHHPNSRATFMPGVMNINNTNIWEEARPTSYSSSQFPEPRHHSGDCYPPGSGYPPR